MLAKLKEYRIGKRGIRGFNISLPKIFLEDNQIEAGDKVEMHRGQIENHGDVLVIIPKPTEVNAQKPSDNISKNNNTKFLNEL